MYDLNFAVHKLPSTPARTLSISGLKSRVLTLSFFELKNDGKKCSRIYFEIDRAPSEIPAKLPGQFCADIFALGSSYSEHFLPSFLSSKMIISRLQILVHL